MLTQELAIQDHGHAPHHGRPSSVRNQHFQALAAAPILQPPCGSEESRVGRSCPCPSLVPLALTSMCWRTPTAPAAVCCWRSFALIRGVWSARRAGSQCWGVNAHRSRAQTREGAGALTRQLPELQELRGIILPRLPCFPRGTESSCPQG